MNLKKEVVIISIILCIVSLVLIVGFIMPFLDFIKNSPMELIKLEKDLEFFQGVTSRTGDIKEAYEEIKPDLKKADNLFIDLESPINLIKFFQVTAKNNYLSINISPMSSEKGFDDQWDSLIFRLNLIGSYNNFMRFLEKIENGPYLIEGKELSIRNLTKGQANSGYFPDDINADLTIKIFVK